MRLTIRVRRGFDGRWIAEATELDWVVGYGVTQEEAICKVQQLAIEDIAESVTRGELAESAFNLVFEVVRPSGLPSTKRPLAYSAWLR